jgi:hypothetical protein
MIDISDLGMPDQIGKRQTNQGGDFNDDYSLLRSGHGTWHCVFFSG